MDRLTYSKDHFYRQMQYNKEKLDDAKIRVSVVENKNKKLLAKYKKYKEEVMKARANKSQIIKECPYCLGKKFKTRKYLEGHFARRHPEHINQEILIQDMKNTLESEENQKENRLKEMQTSLNSLMAEVNKISQMQEYHTKPIEMKRVEDRLDDLQVKFENTIKHAQEQSVRNNKKDAIPENHSAPIEKIEEKKEEEENKEVNNPPKFKKEENVIYTFSNVYNQKPIGKAQTLREPR